MQRGQFRLSMAIIGVCFLALSCGKDDLQPTEPSLEPRDPYAIPELVGSWSTEGYDLAVDNQGLVYVFRTGSSIAVYSENGEPLEQWAPYLPGSLQSAKGISFGENQFVIRTMGHPLPDRVAIYNSNREFEVDWYEPNLSGWPGGGSDVLTVGLDGMIYLLGFGEETVYKYDPDEGLVNSWSTVGTDTTGASWPFGVAVNKQGLVYISNTLHDQVLCFSTEGDLLAEYGGPGNGPGQFHSPYGLAVDVDGILYVADARNQRIQKFNADGEFLGSFGSWSDDQKPYHIAVSGDEVYVSCGRPGIGPSEVFHFSYAGQ